MVDCTFLYDQDFFKEQLEKNHYVEKKLSYKSYDNAYIVPFEKMSSGVYTEEKEFVGCSALHNAVGVPLARDKVESVQYNDETVIYLGVLYPVWGHALTDHIRRFWFLKTDIYVNEFKNCKLIFVNYNERKVPENFYRLFEIMGVDRSKLMLPSEMICYKKVIIPDDCFFCDDNALERYFTSEYRSLINDVRMFQREHLRIDKTCEKMYFSYASCGKNRDCIGEKKLEKFFKTQGYRIVYPERYSIDEQLNMLANCHYFASTVGSCSHNMIFLPDHANVVLIPRAFYIASHQRPLDQVIDLNIYYVDASLSVLASRKNPWGGPFFFYESENLRRFFGIDDPCDRKFYKKQFKDFKKYLRKAKGAYELRERYMPEYYGKQFACCMEQLQSPIRKLWQGFWSYVQLSGWKATIKKILREKQ